MALAPPPPLQILATPYLPFLSLKTVYKDKTILAPLNPIGCPILIAPPWTFTFSGSKSISFILASAVAANASFISW